MAEIIFFPSKPDTIVRRVLLGEGITAFFGFAEPAERGYILGYLDAQAGLPSAAASIAEYQSMEERLNGSSTH